MRLYQKYSYYAAALSWCSYLTSHPIPTPGSNSKCAHNYPPTSINYNPIVLVFQRALGSLRSSSSPRRSLRSPPHMSQAHFDQPFHQLYSIEVAFGKRSKPGASRALDPELSLASPRRFPRTGRRLGLSTRRISAPRRDFDAERVGVPVLHPPVSGRSFVLPSIPPLNSRRVCVVFCP